MAEQPIRFDDGAAYEKMMGTWSALAGDVFLDWLAPPQGLRCVDVGCGNGALIERIVQRCEPAEMQGIDPSEGQLAFARTRPGAKMAKFQQGDAMALPFADSAFDLATMALVLFFVPDPAKGVAEMVRVAKSDGIVAAYTWDILGGGFPFEPVQKHMRARGMKPPLPPSVEASRLENTQALWSGAGLKDIETREIIVQRTFRDFDEFWSITTLGPSMAPIIGAMPGDDRKALMDQVRRTLPADGAGRITCSARANAIKGRVAK